VWQGRFRAFAIQEDEHLLTVLRYVERNALRANLVGRAQDWFWSSLRERQAPWLLPFLPPSPVPLPDCWLAHVNEPLTEVELGRVRQSVRRGCPFGTEVWVHDTAGRLGLESTLRAPGHQPRSLQRDSDDDASPLFRQIRREV
jgi:putative transposase